MGRLHEIYEVVKTERPVLVKELKEDRFETTEDKAAVISGITFFVGSEVLRSDNPLSLEASDIANDICFFLIMGMEPEQ